MEPLLSRSTIDELRDDATRIPTHFTDDTTGLPVENPERLKAYQQVFEAAKMAGYRDRMVEVAPFARHRVTDEDYRTCLEQARAVEDLTSVIACRRALGEQLDHDDLGVFFLGKRQLNLEQHLGHQAAWTLEELRDLFSRVVNPQNLAPQDAVLFRAFQLWFLEGEVSLDDMLC